MLEGLARGFGESTPGASWTQPEFNPMKHVESWMWQQTLIMPALMVKRKAETGKS